jgi:ABC-type Fe3+-siderophore transport system permease subunit
VTKVVAKIVGALLAAAAGIVLALDGAGLVDAPTRLLVACIVVSAALAAISTIAAAFSTISTRSR